MPVSDAAKAAILKLFEGETDYLAGMSAEAKAAYLDATSYRSFLKDKAGLPDDALACFQKRSHDFFAIGIDGVPASWAMETGYPRLRGDWASNRRTRPRRRSWRSRISIISPTGTPRSRGCWSRL